WTLRLVDTGRGTTPWPLAYLALAVIASLAVATALGRMLVDRDRQSKARAATEGLLEATLNSVDTGVVVFDPTGVVARVNPLAQRLCGLVPGDAYLAVATSSFALRGPDGSPIPVEANPLSRALNGETVVEEEFLLRSGIRAESVISASARPVVSSDRRLLGAVVTLRDVTIRDRYERTILERSRTDAVTGLANRSCLLESLAERLTRSQASEGTVCVSFIDLDGFKPVNDTFGHDAGDQALRAVAGRLRAAVRGNDFVARLGGDEFVVVFDGNIGLAAAQAHRLLAAISQPIAVIGGVLQVTASCGVAAARPGDSSDGVLHRADMLMYTAKASGTGGVAVEADISDATLARDRAEWPSWDDSESI
ncbi:MAG: diguanylate cyclase, partial [Actinomycetota bacterium]|nr:diguanylate cyclase [Actinomycetota bacterium]